MSQTTHPTNTASDSPSRPHHHRQWTHSLEDGRREKRIHRANVEEDESIDAIIRQEDGFPQSNLDHQHGMQREDATEGEVRNEGINGFDGKDDDRDDEEEHPFERDDQGEAEPIEGEYDDAGDVDGDSQEEEQEQEEAAEDENNQDSNNGDDDNGEGDEYAEDDEDAESDDGDAEGDAMMLDEDQADPDDEFGEGVDENDDDVYYGVEDDVDDDDDADGPPSSFAYRATRKPQIISKDEAVDLTLDDSEDEEPTTNSKEDNETEEEDDHDHEESEEAEEEQKVEEEEQAKEKEPHTPSPPVEESLSTPLATSSVTPSTTAHVGPTPSASITPTSSVPISSPSVPTTVPSLPHLEPAAIPPTQSTFLPSESSTSSSPHDSNAPSPSIARAAAAAAPSSPTPNVATVHSTSPNVEMRTDSPVRSVARPLFTSPFASSPYTAHKSKQFYQSSLSSSSSTNGSQLKAEFMSPPQRSQKSPNRSPQPINLTTQPINTANNHFSGIPSTFASSSSVFASRHAAPSPRSSNTYLSTFIQRRLPIKHWDQAKVQVERRMRKHPHPLRALISTFPYSTQSLLPPSAAPPADYAVPHSSSASSSTSSSTGRIPTSIIQSARSFLSSRLSKKFYFNSNQTTPADTRNGGNRDESSFRSIERKRLEDRAAQLERQAQMIQQYRKRQQQKIDDELDLTLDSLSMSDVTVTRSNVGEQSLKVQNEFISNDIDRRIRIEKVAPMWLVQALLEDIMDEAKEELVKEAVADGKRVCLLSDSDMKKSTELMQSPLKKVIADKFDIELVGGDLVKLRNLDWLSDQTINFYMEMLAERQRRNQTSNNVLPSQKNRIHYFNTFFYKKLSPDAVKYSFKDVARWTKRAKVDVFTLDKVILPVHVNGNHWTLGIINLKQRRFEYYDSLGGRNPLCLQHMKQWTIDEITAHHPTQVAALDIPSWESLHVTDIPRQNNGSDCGVFTIKFADYASEDRPFNFTHRDMPYFRRRIALEILFQRVL